MIDFQAMAMLRGTRRWGPTGPLKGKHYLRVFFCEECNAMRLSRINSTSKYCKSCSCKGARSFRWKGGISLGENRKKYQNEATKKWRLRHPERIKKYSRESWGMKNLTRQEEIAGRPCPDHCEICGAYHPRKINIRGAEKYRLHFDHDHLTGKFRGWLCHNCNHALGSAKDNPEILRKMIKYLEENSHGVH